LKALNKTVHDNIKSLKIIQMHRGATRQDEI